MFRAAHAAQISDLILNQFTGPNACKTGVVGGAGASCCAAKLRSRDVTQLPLFQVKFQISP